MGFAGFARATARLIGRPGTFVLSLVLTGVWAVCGPWTGYSDTWQLVINTATTVLTLFVALLIQNTQDRDTAAIQLKLDEIVKALDRADNRVIGIEERSEQDIKAHRDASQGDTPS